jgi:hypothetical protein
MTHRTIVLVLFGLLALGCSDADENPRMYSAGAVQWGTACEPFEPVTSPSFGPTDEPCIELILEGYYTRGDLTAVYYLDEQEIGGSSIGFTPTGAFAQRMARQAAESRVTFQLHHAGQPLPASNLYSVAMQRAGTEVARYPFEIVER